MIGEKKALVSYSGMNHYSVNNWNEGDDAPCGAPRTENDEGSFEETAENHEAGTTLIANAWAQMANAFLFGDEQAIEFLKEGVKKEPRYSLSRLNGL